MAGAILAGEPRAQPSGQGTLGCEPVLPTDEAGAGKDPARDDDDRADAAMVEF